ncbi:unnamed protein product [Polarella glacialis]|uniref:Uncharacterized protein n=1 Tax=Polarella glacialis TaxID=89957 RepID=A0A813GPH7_POLGL|nr:unnamed protein product [Polarella glacialis]
MNGLCDVVPAHLRFSSGAGAGLQTRNLIIRNTSVGPLPLRIEPPGAPICVQLGGDRLGKEITLAVGETTIWHGCANVAPPL